MRARNPRRSRRTGSGTLRRLLLALALVVTTGAAFATTQAFTAANTVPTTNISQFTQAITPANLEPAECKAVFTVTSIVAGSGAITSTAANQLVLGSSAVDTLTDGGSGTACMVGGLANDFFQGVNGGGDLCIVSSTTTNPRIKKCTVVATRP